MGQVPAAEAAERFAREYGRAPAGLAFAPGRVNVIGEHTDYNDGWALPAAVDLATYIAYAPRDDGRVRIYSEMTGREAAFELDGRAAADLAFWARYAWGTGMALLEAGLGARPVDMYALSNVPMGGGLSSSASFEVALALAYLGREEAEALDRLRLVHLCRRAENHFVGVNCGVMDQFSSVFGAEGKALLLDCRSLESREVPFPEGIVIVVADTSVRHALGEETEGYHRRQQECREAVAVLSRLEKNVESLRDVTLSMIEEHTGELGDRLARRARHVVSENARVLEAAEAMAGGEVERLGALLRSSHESLRDDFEVSCRELDLMVEAAEGIDGHHGSRMVGGGFGGCTISLVDEAKAPAFCEELSGRYGGATGLDAGMHVVRPGRGAGFVGA